METNIASVTDCTPEHPDHKYLYATMIIRPEILPEVKTIVRAITINKNRYAIVASMVNKNLPWIFVGFTHYMECNLSFLKHLHNGDLLSARTVHKPIGRPAFGTPPFSWEQSATDALKYEGYEKDRDWSIPAMLNTLEHYNGLGYRMHGIYSPYLWAGTNHYEKGKYIEMLRDPNNKKAGYKSVWKPDLVSQQIGCAAILKLLSEV
jgi:lysozyme family protein